MAITATPTATDLILVMNNGTGASGQQLTISRIFGDVKPAATHADVYNVAQSLLGLQSKAHIAVQRRDFNEIADI